ncbi:MAG: ParB/RepB/Spo0J family partition protein [Oscillospiraceae bacterium]|nr:ParB/RepB/Spo0J family partition protein [Oscillospiraceae bacterium]
MTIFKKRATSEAVQINKVIEVEVGNILPNPAQPRVIFDESELSQLALSIRQNGILQPLTVRQIGVSGNDGGSTGQLPPPFPRYELIAGERRLRAAKLAGVEKVPCIVLDKTVKESALLAIMENIQRANLNYIEEAFAIKRLIDFLGITQEAAAIKLGMAQSTVANKLRLLQLSDREKALALRERLNERQARSLLRLPESLREGVIRQIGEQGLNTAMADKLIGELLRETDSELSDPFAGKNAEGKGGKKQLPARKSFYVTQTRIYMNTFDHAIDSMKKAGIACEATQRKTEEFVEYVVKIPLK